MAKKATKRMKGTGSIIPRKDGRIEARVTVGVNSKNGKPIKKSKYFKTKAEAQKWLTQTTALIDNGQYIISDTVTVTEWLTKWFEDYVKDIKQPNTVSEYEQAIRLRIIPYLGEMKIGDLRQAHIQELVKRLSAEKHYSPKTVREAIGVLANALNRAIENKMICENPCNRIKYPKKGNAAMTIMSKQEVADFLGAIDGSGYRNELFVLLYTGLRKSELIGLTWDCVDFSKRELHIYRQYGYDRMNHTNGFEPLKNSKPRDLAMSDAVYQVFLDQKDKQEMQASCAGALWDNCNNFVFTNGYGHPICPTTLHKNFKRICAPVGLDKMTIHDLRHNFATYSLYAGVDIKTVQEDLGHATPAFTMKQYAQATMEMKRHGAKQFDEFMEAVSVAANED